MPPASAPESTLATENLHAIFKAYDVRGTVGDQIDEVLARRIGGAFVAVTGVSTVVVGYDMRPSSPGLAGAFADGASAAGADVVVIGLASTDQLYFASGHLDLAGVMFTASHNPAAYNGIKMCLPGARPIGAETGLLDIRDAVATEVTGGRVGSITNRDVLAEYAHHLLSLAPVTGRRLKVVVDAGNGMAGHTAPAVFDRLADQVEVVPMYFELDGTFPNHEANPIEPANLVDLQKRVRAENADIGLAFDGDADRCFLVDERGELVSPSTLTGLIAARELAREPGATIIHNLITSRSVPEIVAELGGTPVRTRVGHSFIKATMAETDAIFGGEHSGHFYFRDFWRADSGMLAALHALAALAETEQPLSQLLGEYVRFVASGEINSTVADQAAILHELEASYAGTPGVALDHLDGLTVAHDDWWFNVRASNTEPLLRLNAEGKDEATMVTMRDAVLSVIRRDQ
ncbi:MULTISPECIES: phosphomannomutase/phosphoglucomutase [unclassified Nocardioides]|uniref:phosphomannomutase/phosphoglucomutase n=1 Tax=unclassified Nocardioides TaxID=2615069 RepID=UPI0006FCAB67|nr:MULTISPECIES: phosphomannomutase/phosphoglucomutase [unclassified Nocardioides]KQY56271.1 phosphoglucosamine mutase [Nocardioides sp. Root140]KRF10589.1 phosphoglucosamine mutase [Nocardioides sp. Soil796]